MVKEYFRDVRPGDSLFKEAWSARAYNRRSRAIQHDNNFVHGSNNHYITTEAFHGYWTDDDEPLVKLVRLKKDLLPSFLTDNDQSSLSSSSNKKEDDGTNAIVLYHNGDDWADSDPPEEIYVSDVFGLPYDKNDRHWVTFHPEFGRWVILDRNTIRLAVTVKDDDGTYPKAEDTPNVYPIEFVTPTYKKDSGKQDIDFKEKHGEAQPDWMQPPHAYCANLWNNYPDAYIPEGTPIWCFWQWQQWFTFVCCGQTDERSSGSSSSVISNRQTYTMRKTSVPSGQGKPGGPYLFDYVMSEKTPEEIARSGGGQPDEQGRTSPGDTPGGPVSGGGGGPSASVNALVVEDIDSSPRVDGITTLQFDQSDGFVISQSVAGTARIDFTIPNDTVTYAMMQNASTGPIVLGRVSGSGDIQEITVTYPVLMYSSNISVVGYPLYLHNVMTGTTTNSYAHVTNGITGSPFSPTTGGVFKLSIKNTGGSNSLDWKIIATDKWGVTETLTRTVAPLAKGNLYGDSTEMTTLGCIFSSVSVEVISTSAGNHTTYDLYVCEDA